MLLTFCHELHYVLFLEPAGHVLASCRHLGHEHKYLFISTQHGFPSHVQDVRAFPSFITVQKEGKNLNAVKFSIKVRCCSRKEIFEQGCKSQHLSQRFQICNVHENRRMRPVSDAWQGTKARACTTTWLMHILIALFTHTQVEQL